MKGWKQSHKRKRKRKTIHDVWVRVNQQGGSGAAAAGARGSFQSPHEQPEHLMELSDDLAPAAAAAADTASNSGAVYSDPGPILDNAVQPKPEHTVLKGLPSQIKIVVQEKQKFLSTTKRPIIMPSMAKELPQWKPVEAKPAFISQKKPTSFKPTFKTIPTKISKPHEVARALQQMSKQPKQTLVQNTNKSNLVKVAVQQQQPESQQSKITNVGKKPTAMRVQDKAFVPAFTTHPGPAPTNVGKKPTAMRVQDKAFVPAFTTHPGPAPMRFPSGIPKSFLIQQQNTQQQWLAESSFQSGAQSGWTEVRVGISTGAGGVGMTGGTGAGSMGVGMGTGAGSIGMGTGAGSTGMEMGTGAGSMGMGMNTGASGVGMSPGAGAGSMDTCTGAVEVGAVPALYSPTEQYKSADIATQECVSPAESQASTKRMSAFERLGPQQENKASTKLIINLHQNKDTLVRQVVRPVQWEPVESRACVVNSADPVVREYRAQWPWRRNVPTVRTVTHRHSTSVMILEQEQMEVYYDSDQRFLLITVVGYPVTWCKEQVLDVMLDKLKGKTFIPFFINFTAEKCKLFVLRNRSALIAIHRLGFQIHADDVTLHVSISLPDLTVNNIQFIPRLVLRRILTQGYDGELSLSLKEFTLKPDISNFIYFPLSRESNQLELLQLQSDVAWEYLTHLDLSYNRITSLEGFDLAYSTPKLKHLDLSHNCIESVRVLVASRNLPLTSLHLHANPLCRDYTDSDAYVQVLRMLFPTLKEIDGVRIHRGGFPPALHTGGVYSTAGYSLAAASVQLHARLLQRAHARERLRDVYHAHALLDISHTYTRGISGGLRTLLSRVGRVAGAAAVLRVLMRWPALQHDLHSFTIDLLHHSNTATIYRVSGLMKVTSESLAEDEHVVWFSRSVVLTTEDGSEYRIKHELLTYSEPTDACAHDAFQIVHTDPKPISLVFDSTPDEDLKEKLIIILMKLSTLDKSQSEECLEKNNWNLKKALEYFIKLLKLNDLDALNTTALA